MLGVLSGVTWELAGVYAVPPKGRWAEDRTDSCIARELNVTQYLKSSPKRKLHRRHPNHGVYATKYAQQKPQTPTIGQRSSDPSRKL